MFSRSGAYLFKPDPLSAYPNVPVFTREDAKETVVINGPIYSEVTKVERFKIIFNNYI